MLPALKINAGNTLQYVVSGGKVRILKARSVAELSGMLKRPSQASVSVEVMDEAIADWPMAGFQKAKKWPLKQR